MKKMIQKILPVADIMLMPFVYPAAWLLKSIRKAGVIIDYRTVRMLCLM